MDTLEETITELKVSLTQQVQIHDAPTFYLLRTSQGIDRILALPSSGAIRLVTRRRGRSTGWLDGLREQQPRARSEPDRRMEFN